MQYELSPLSYVAFSRFLHEKLGIVLGDNRQYLVRSRLTAIANNLDYTSIDVFIKDVIEGKDHALIDQCLELMTTNETFWFRDIYPFSLLKSHLLPDLSKQQRKLRIWSSACASGQEAYSIAMTIEEYKRENSSAFPDGIEIVATDYSAKMIGAAQAGIYDELALGRGLDNKYRERYFEKSPSTVHKNAMQLSAKIKRMVQFKRFNLLHEFNSMGKFDIIFCRNVLIYFDGNQKIQTLLKFAACLPQSGALMLGAAESINGADSIFKMQTVDKGLYYSKL
jgi:chemotaxis protein methyltransferase CheR